MVGEHEYTQLHERLNRAQQTRAVLADREKAAAAERERLSTELIAKGIDVTEPEKEIKRLEAEIQQNYNEQLGKIAKFEQDLQAAQSGAQPVVLASANDLDM